MNLFAKTRESTTLQLLLVPLILVNYKYFTGDITSATEFSMAITSLLTVWLGREWRSAHYTNNIKNSAV